MVNVANIPYMNPMGMYCWTITVIYGHLYIHPGATWRSWALKVPTLSLGGDMSRDRETFLVMFLFVDSSCGAFSTL